MNRYGTNASGTHFDRTGTRGGARALLTLTLVPLLALWVAGLASPAAAAPSRGELTGVVNINTASAAELQLLPGVGKSRAGAIVKLRQERGGFKRVEDLTLVGGIGDAMLDSMRPHVTLVGKTTARRAASGKSDAASSGSAKKASGGTR